MQTAGYRSQLQEKRRKAESNTIHLAKAEDLPETTARDHLLLHKGTFFEEPLQA